MIAEQKEGLLVVPEIVGHKFKRFEAGLGWPDPNGRDHELHYVAVVAGEHEDGRIFILEEFAGKFPGLLTWLIDAKDRLLMTRCWIANDQPNAQTLHELRQAEGLCQYHNLGTDIHGKPIWETPDPSAVWNHYRGRDHVLSLVPANPMLVANPRAGADLIQLWPTWNKVVFDAACQLCSGVFRSIEISDALNHPALRAVIYVASGMKSTIELPETNKRFEAPSHGRLRREMLR